MKMHPSKGMPIYCAIIKRTAGRETDRVDETPTPGSFELEETPPDGHTMALVASSHAINPSMFKKLPYDHLNRVLKKRTS